MRLINVQSLRLESFPDALSVPPYAILSHTWEHDEVLFADLDKAESTSWSSKYAARKIHFSVEQAQRDGLGYIWIDNCCIDKTSSAELSESINSMFKWYACARICYAYLADARAGTPIQTCRWFTRGFTLQELIAPREIYFFDRDWQSMGSRTELQTDLIRITGIDPALFARRPTADDPSLALTSLTSLLDSVNVATRMSWASKRSTTRLEDVAYCLLGIFNVNMPLLYGEGIRSFQRLQEEIIKRSDDMSVLAFQGDVNQPPSFMARHPRGFISPLPSVHCGASQKPKLDLGKGRVTLDLILCPATRQNPKSRSSSSVFYGIFDCTFPGEWLARPAILLRQAGPSSGLTFVRDDPHLYCVNIVTSDSFSGFVQRWIPEADRSFNAQTSSQVFTGTPIPCQAAKHEVITIFENQKQDELSWLPHAVVFIDDPFKKSGFAVGRSIQTPPKEFPGGSMRPTFTAQIPHGIIHIIGSMGHGFFVTWGVKEILSTLSVEKFTLKPWCLIWTIDLVLRTLSSDSEPRPIAEETILDTIFNDWERVRGALVLGEKDRFEVTHETWIGQHRVCVSI